VRLEHTCASGAIEPIRHAEHGDSHLHVETAFESDSESRPIWRTSRCNSVTATNLEQGRLRQRTGSLELFFDIVSSGRVTVAIRCGVSDFSLLNPMSEGRRWRDADHRNWATRLDARRVLHRQATRSLRSALGPAPRHRTSRNHRRTMVGH
jgi:hypothetical protein